MRVAGVDEAGRGSILGPLVVAGISASKSAIDELVRLGVKDSKQLTAFERERLYPKIFKLCTDVKTEVLPPAEVDKFVRRRIKFKTLNYLEAIAIARILSDLNAEVSYVDSCDINPRRFARTISDLMDAKRKLIVSHKADQIYTAVSAASIIAKVSRDRHIEKLRRKYGEIGSGYPSDPQTIEFLTRWVKKEFNVPSFARRSWRTWLRITPTLEDFTRS